MERLAAFGFFNENYRQFFRQLPSILLKKLMIIDELIDEN